MAEKQKIIIYWNAKKTVTLICGLLFIPFFFLFIFSLTLKNTLVNPQYYKDSLKKINAYSRIVNEGIPSVILEMQISDNKLTDSLAKELTVFLIQKFVDPAWIQNTTETVIDKTIAFFKNPDQGIDVNLSNYQGNLDKLSSGLLIAENLLPDSPQNQEASSSASKMAATLGEVKKDLQGIREAVDKTSLGVVRVDETIKKVNSFIQTVHSFIAYLDIFLWVSVVAMLAITGVIVYLQWKDPYMIAKQISLFAGVASAVSLITIFLVSIFVPKGLGNQELMLSTAVRGIINDFLKTMVSGIFLQMETYAAIVLAASLFVFAAAYFIERKGKRFFKHIFK